MNLPGPVPKKRKVVPVRSELPTFPILVNQKALQKRTKLAMLQAPRKKQAPVKEPEA